MGAEFGLGRRGEQRMVELTGLHEAAGQVDAADRAGPLIVQQPGPGEIAAGHAFHRHHVELTNHQRPAQHFSGDAGVVRRSGQVVGVSRMPKKNTLIAVRIRPLSGIRVSRMKSKAEIRSEATNSRCSSSIR